MMKKAFICLVLLVSLVLSGSAWASFTNMVSFGDSLSDDGINIWGDNQGFTRSSNGLVWVEYLAMNLGLSHDGRAYGGALTGQGNVVTGPDQYGLLWQTENYMSGGDISNTLFTVWAGGNDLRSITDPSDAPGVINSAIGNIGTAITSLYGKGARNILIPNLPDLGITPEVNWNLALSGAASAASGMFNQGLDTMLGSLSLPGLHIFEMDVFTYLNTVILPGGFFTNTTDPWLGSGDRPSEYLFFDNIHPTTDGHWLLAEYAAETITNATNSVPVPAAVWLLGSGILCLAGIRRKTR